MEKIKEYILDFINEYWKWLLVFLSVLCLLLFVLLFSLFLMEPNETSGSYENTIGELEENGIEKIEKGAEAGEETINEKLVEEEAVPTTLFIDIKGAVKHPGVYEITTGKRVIDAVDEAGGFNEEADSNSVNLAQLLTDQMVIYVAKVGEEINDVGENILEQGEETQAGQVININRAELSELIELNGIGDAKAGNIITYREENGNFESIEEIKEVSGIGDKIFEGIKEEITVQ